MPGPQFAAGMSAEHEENPFELVANICRRFAGIASTQKTAAQFGRKAPFPCVRKVTNSKV
jgi:hypothetical protein